MLKRSDAEIVPLLICGGVGKRLWPLSREQHPKQMLRLYNTKTLIQNTLLRLQQIHFLEKPIIVCNKKRRFIMGSQVAETNVPIQEMLLESKSMNTAPAIALSALHLQKKYGNVLMLVMPVDHKIDHIHCLMECIETAIPCALDNNIVALGVKPRTPNTNYGYIEVVSKEGKDIYPVNHFTEKPNLQTAQLFLKNKNYFWNTGIFLFSVERILQDFSQFHPEILHHCKQALASATTENDLISTGEEFSLCPNISIDYAIMEKAKNIYMVELKSNWTDIGNWQLLYDIEHKNEQGNFFHGNIVSIDTKNCYVRSDHRLVATIGMEDCFVIETRDATLIAHKNHLNKIPDLVTELEKNNRLEAVMPATVHRPWGYYTSIESGTNFQIKKIVVHPHQKLSLQEHQYRSEHWVILKGKASVVLGHETYTLGPNESTFVPLGVRHQLINNEESDLELIEVQMGTYLREDDIKRYDDMYHRDKADV